MLLYIISIILNAAFIAVLNLSFYTDRTAMPTGEALVRHRSPIDRLYIMDKPALLYLQLAIAAVSVITSILLICGVKNGVVKTVQLISTAASAVMFIIIMIVTSNSGVRYA